MRGLRNDAGFTRVYVLEPDQVIYVSYTRIYFGKLVAKPPKQDRNADRDRAYPHHRSDYCGDDGSPRPIFAVGVVLGQLAHHHARVNGSFLGPCGWLYPYIKDLGLFEVWDDGLLCWYFVK